jgi:hypothetical protein
MPYLSQLLIVTQNHSFVIPAMKKLFTAVLLTFPFFGYAQDGFSFPEGLKIDPYAYEMKVLEIERIEQVHTTYFYDSLDADRIDSNYVFEYIVEYDSAGRISSFKYDFQKEYGRTVMSSPEGQVTMYGYNDTSRLEVLIRNADTTYFNYYENQFRYNPFNELENIQIVRPYRGGIIDGVFIKEPEHDKIVVEKMYEANELSRITVFIDGVIQYSETYHYSTLSKNNTQLRVLTKIIRESANRKDVYQMKYLQY